MGTVVKSDCGHELIFLNSTGFSKFCSLSTARFNSGTSEMHSHARATRVDDQIAVMACSQIPSGAFSETEAVLCRKESGWPSTTSESLSKRVLLSLTILPRWQNDTYGESKNFHVAYSLDLRFPGASNSVMM